MTDFVIASDGKEVRREMLSEYEKTLQSLHPRPKNIREEDEMEANNLEETTKVSDDAVIVNYIMLARIYDLLCVIGDSLGKGEDVLRIMNLHREGQLMSPPPTLQTPESQIEEI